MNATKYPLDNTLVGRDVIFKVAVAGHEADTKHGTITRFSPNGNFVFIAGRYWNKSKVTILDVAPSGHVLGFIAPPPASEPAPVDPPLKMPPHEEVQTLAPEEKSPADPANLTNLTDQAPPGPAHTLPQSITGAESSSPERESIS